MTEADVPADAGPAGRADFSTGRLEAFSDGVFAIAITLLVLDLGFPQPDALHGTSLASALAHQWPSYFAYLVSFLVIGIIWINHHAMCALADRVDRRTLFANLLLLLTVSVIPYPTRMLAAYLTTPGRDGHTAAAVYAATMVAMGAAFSLLLDVDSDLYKPYHPQYDALLARDDKLMAACTRADGRAWMARAHEYARVNKINAVVQETSQDGAAVARTMEAYRQAGFRVEVMALGVPAAMSNQGIVHRYHEQVRERGHGRLTVQANADQSYTGILDLAEQVDAGRLADQVAVLRRGEDAPRYGNTLDRSGRWQAPPAFRAAVEAERSRPWTETERVDFQRTQVKLRAEMGGSWTSRLDTIEAQGCLTLPAGVGRSGTRALAFGPRRPFGRRGAR